MIITRRRFEEDTRRHFAGVVTEAVGTAVRVEGYSFLFDTSKNQFVKMPANAVIENLVYKVSDRGNLILTDNQQFSMDINEFGVKR